MNAQLEDATEDDKKIIDLENRTVEITADMRFYGIAFDKKRWVEIAVENEAKYKAQLVNMPATVKVLRSASLGMFLMSMYPLTIRPL